MIISYKNVRTHPSIFKAVILHTGSWGQTKEKKQSGK